MTLLSPFSLDPVFGDWTRDRPIALCHRSAHNPRSHRNFRDFCQAREIGFSDDSPTCRRCVLYYARLARCVRSGGMRQFWAKHPLEPVRSSIRHARQGRKDRGHSMNRFAAFLLALTVALAIAAAPAFAQTSGSGYSTPAGEVQADVSGTPAGVTDTTPPASSPRQASGSQLPFTGLDVGLVLGAGLALLLVGGALSRLTRSGRTRTE